MQGQHQRARTPVDACPHMLTLDVAGEAEDQTEGAILRATEPRRDSTALTAFSVHFLKSGLPVFLVQDRYHWTGTPHHDLLPAILRIADIWRADQLILDATGIGAGLASFLRAELGSRLVPFVFTSESKSRLGWEFLALCNSGRFLDHAPDDSAEYAQFWREVAAADYEVVDSPSRRMRWGVADPRIHDDLLISAALIAAAQDLVAPQMGAVIEAGDVVSE